MREKSKTYRAFLGKAVCAPFSSEERFLLDFEIFHIAAYTLLKSGDYTVSFLPSAQYELLVAPVASNRYFEPKRQPLVPLYRIFPTPSMYTAVRI
jgi:hypothetical protein